MGGTVYRADMIIIMETEFTFIVLNETGGKDEQQRNTSVPY